jgi:DNA polymerase-1
MKKDLLNLLNTIQEDNAEIPQNERYMLIDGLNLFFRNFSAINTINSNGNHIGGLGGFFRSLGALIRQIQPTQVVIVFDGVGSSNNRKNIIPEYKSGRNITRVTKHELFDDIEEEDESKYNQIVRIIQYLKTLPVKVITLGKVEADDVIAYMSDKLVKSADDRVFIVSSDKDYLQLISQQVIVYRPIEREYYTEATVRDKFKLDPHNFILYKSLMGDSSDALPGIKGLGEKKLFKLFPELSTQDLTFEDILEISEKRMTENVIYARILQDVELLEKKYQIMDLSNPMMTDDDKTYVDEFIKHTDLPFFPKQFLEMYEEDQIGGLIRNPEYWCKIFSKNCLKINRFIVYL